MSKDFVYYMLCPCCEISDYVWSTNDLMVCWSLYQLGGADRQKLGKQLIYRRGIWLVFD